MTLSARNLHWLRKRGVLLVLVFAYLLSSALIIMQQRIIDSQRVLIRDLFRDSMELSQMKMKQTALKH